MKPLNEFDYIKLCLQFIYIQIDDDKLRKILSLHDLIRDKKGETTIQEIINIINNEK